jgi:hypothetical protein
VAVLDSIRLRLAFTAFGSMVRVWWVRKALSPMRRGQADYFVAGAIFKRGRF